MVGPSSMTARPPELPVNPVRKFLLRYPWHIGAAFGVLFLTGIRPFLRHVPEPPPSMYTLPAYQLVDQAKKPFTPEMMHGKVWVASFAFTSCPSACPALVAALGRLQERYEKNDIPVEIVTLTVDPEHDTPDVLAAYASELGADPTRWRFVTGSRAQLEALVVGGFKLALGEQPPPDATMYDIAHSTKIALVDAHGGVRGYYGTDEPGLDEVFHRSQHVLDEARTSP